MSFFLISFFYLEITRSPLASIVNLFFPSASPYEDTYKIVEIHVIIVYIWFMWDHIYYCIFIAIIIWRYSYEYIVNIVIFIDYYILTITVIIIVIVVIIEIITLSNKKEMLWIDSCESGKREDRVRLFARDHTSLCLPTSFSTESFRSLSLFCRCFVHSLYTLSECIYRLRILSCLSN